MVGHELRQVEHIRLSELLLHLVQLIGAYSIEVSSIKLLLHQLGDRVLVQEGSGALEVIVDDPGVILVFKVGSVRVLSGKIFGIDAWCRRERWVIAVTFRHFNVKLMIVVF